MKRPATFNGVRIFSATMAPQRERLGEEVTNWINENPECVVSDIVVTQSSDAAFHCIVITVFYWEERGRQPPASRRGRGTA